MGVTKPVTKRGARSAGPSWRCRPPDGGRSSAAQRADSGHTGNAGRDTVTWVTWPGGSGVHRFRTVGQIMHGLTGDLRDEAEILVPVENGETGKFGGGRDQEIGYR